MTVCKAESLYSHESYPEIQIETVFRELFATKGVQADDALVIHAGQFFRVLTTEYIRLYEGVERMLKQLQEQGKKIYLLSNAQRIFTEYELHMLGRTGRTLSFLWRSEISVGEEDVRYLPAETAGYVTAYLQRL